jgi:hypothetical protein
LQSPLLCGGGGPGETRRLAESDFLAQLSMADTQGLRTFRETILALIRRRKVEFTVESLRALAPVARADEKASKAAAREAAAREAAAAGSAKEEEDAAAAEAAKTDEDASAAEAAAATLLDAAAAASSKTNDPPSSS